MMTVRLTLGLAIAFVAHGFMPVRPTISLGSLKNVALDLSRSNRGYTTLTMKSPEGEYDYIISGGGLAGCVLANRLSPNGDKRVLVVEAGTGNPMHPFVRIPAGVLRTFKNAKFDWIFQSEQEKTCNDRSIYLCRGKLLGGSSSTNVLLYNRGDKADYDSWAKEYNLEGWDGDNVLPYFKKSEDDLKGLSPAYHSRGGPVAVCDVPYQNPLSRTFLEACSEQSETGDFISDFNDWSQPQTGYGRFSVMERKGERSGAYKEYLKPALKRKNLDVCTGSMVSKINFDGTKATGVQVETGASTTAVRLAPGGEVLLCGGALQSPQLLMLSGLGPKDHLSELGIPVLKDLPGVGKNLQDHPAAVVSYECSAEHAGISPTSLMRIRGTKLTNPLPVLQWLLKKTGVLTSVGCDHGGFFRTSKASGIGDQADLQMRFLAARAVTADGMGSFTSFRESSTHPDGFSFQSIAVRAHSRGQVRLASTKASDMPLVEMKYLDDKRDLETMREGLKLSRRLANSPSFEKYGATEVYPGAHVQSNDDLDAYIRNTLHTSNALVGTCRMGTDDNAVVDPELRVRGIEGVRVCDASVIPRIPGGQTGAPTYMIAEKAAELIQSPEETTKTPEMLFVDKELEKAKKEMEIKKAATKEVEGPVFG